MPLAVVMLLAYVCPIGLTDRSASTLVITNPADSALGPACMSRLAPWIAWQKKGVLLFTNQKGDDVRQVVERALREPRLKHIEHVILVGTPQAIPMEKRKNPYPGKDEWIETEPLSPGEGEPFSFSVGRIFHKDAAVVAMMLGRARHWEQANVSRPKALLVSNPGGSLKLLEVFSRGSAAELKNAGFEVDAFFGQDCDRAEIRRLLPEQTLFLFEGHQSALIRDYEAHLWKEPLKPSLIFMQSCLALTPDKTGPFLERGALAIIGTSTRTYSGSGGALAHAYVNALVNDGQSLGQSLRSAKNFLLAFSRLKEQRLGEKSQLGGANVRAAWAFTLWGDPTLCLPLPDPYEALPSVQHVARGKKITVRIPQERHPAIRSDRFAADLAPGMRLGGLFVKAEEGEVSNLVPLVFREIHFPEAPVGFAPELGSKGSSKNHVFLWDGRRKAGYLLVRPRTGQSEVRFDVAWKHSSK